MLLKTKISSLHINQIMNKINQRIIDFYLGSKNLKKKFSPMFYDSYRKEQTILSLGLNPSLTRKFEKIIKSNI